MSDGDDSDEGKGREYERRENNQTPRRIEALLITNHTNTNINININIQNSSS